MAEMLVDSAKLDACLDAEADAIRAKTGGSAEIPFDFANNKGFADAIAAIPSGGGGIDPSAFDQIGSFTLAEDVREFDFDISNFDYTKYIVYVNGSGTGADYLYFRFGTGGGYSVYLSGNSYVDRLVVLDILKAGTTYGSNTLTGNTCVGAAISGVGNPGREQPTEISNIRIFAYRAAGVLNAGTSIIVYGGY